MSALDDKYKELHNLKSKIESVHLGNNNSTDEEKITAKKIWAKVNKYIKSGDLETARKYLIHMKNEHSITN